jgi:ABC-type Mn2+/Zn2+ transport system ATPase subunit
MVPTGARGSVRLSVADEAGPESALEKSYGNDRGTAVTEEPILELEAFVCGYDEPLLGPLDYAFGADEFVLVEGPSGIGKSALVKTLVGLLPPVTGGYEWSVEKSRRRFVPQMESLDPVLPATVRDVVETGALRGGGVAGIRGGASDAELRESLEEVGMLNHESSLFRELSGGERQLVLLARALFGDPKVCVLDEPTASMDPEREGRAFEALSMRREERGTTMFVIAHGSRPACAAATKHLEVTRDREVKLHDRIESEDEGTERGSSTR